MGGLDVSRVFAMGGSQSAVYLLSYLNGVQPLTHALDGAILLVGMGLAAPFDSPSMLMGMASLPTDPTDEVVLPPGVQVRDDLDIPVFIVSTETEAETFYSVRQTDGPLLRTWEIAGAAHAGSAASQENTMKTFIRDGLQVPPGMGDAGDVQGTLPNPIVYFPVLDAAQRYLLGWAAGGEPPPSFPWMEITGEPPTIVRDEHGNAKGGVRLPELEAPVAQYLGRGPGGSMLASLTGAMVPFSDEKIRSLFPTRQAYLDAYNAAVDQGVRAGYFSLEAAADIKASAQTRAGELTAW